MHGLGDDGARARRSRRRRAAAPHPPLIVLATCAAWPDLTASDRAFAAALEARGRDVTAAPWNGALAPFAAADAIVIRATWDYHEAPGDYLAWLARCDGRPTFNSADLIRWNLAKTYILDLAARGASVPRSVEAEGNPGAVAAALDALGLDAAVIKPLIGASGFGVEHVRRGDEAAALARARTGKTIDRVLVQDVVAAVRHGELAGVFFDGVFSHGLRRVPADGEFRVNAQYGGRMEAADLPADTVTAMTDVVGLLPHRPLYARVDGISDGGRFTLMEVEVNEPALGLELVPGAADRFADALLARLSSG